MPPAVMANFITSACLHLSYSAEVGRLYMIRSYYTYLLVCMPSLLG